MIKHGLVLSVGTQGNQTKEKRCLISTRYDCQILSSNLSGSTIKPLENMKFFGLAPKPSLHQNAEQSRIARQFWHVFDTLVLGLFSWRAGAVAFLVAGTISDCSSTPHKTIPPQFQDGKPLDLQQVMSE